jgi:hypothetical protein
MRYGGEVMPMPMRYGGMVPMAYATGGNVSTEDFKKKQRKDKRRRNRTAMTYQRC